MNWDFASIGYYLVGIVGAVGTYVLWTLKGKFVSKEDFEAYVRETNTRFEAGSERMGKLTSIIERLSHAVENLPTKDDLHELALAVRDVGGELKAMRVSTTAIEKDIVELRDTVVRHENIIADARGAR